MGTWDIEPKEGVKINDPDDGNYIFTPPSSEIGQRTYEITYTDDNGATGKTIYVVKSTDCYVDPCQNDFEGPVVTFLDGTTSTTVSNEAGNIAVQYNLGDCWEFVSVGKYKEPNNITSFKYDDGKIIYYSANDTLSYIPSEAEYKFKNTKANIVTSSYVKINQESKCSSTDCPVIEAPTTHTLPKDGGTVNVNFNADDCWTLTKSLDKPGSVASFVSEKQIKVEANPTSESRTITASYIFINQYSQTTCNTQNVVITQEKGCSCDDVTYEVVKSSFTHEGGSARIGNLTTCDRDKTSIEVKSGSSYITSGPTIGTPTNDVYPVSITVKSNETRDTTYHVKYVINFDGQQCKPGESETPSYYDLIIEPKGCTCTCSQIHRTDIDTSYNYNTDAHNDVLLKELGIDTNFDCYDKLSVFKYNDVGITEIHYVTGGTIEIGGATYTKLEIRGSLSELTGTNPKRTMRFGIKVCDEDCTELNPFYVYQRCSCGMDNCRNEYPLEGSTVYEDHPLYCNGCDQNWNGDAICVETLNLTKVNYYTRTFQDEAAIRKNRGTSSQKQTVYTGNVWLRNGTNQQSSNTLNPNYVGEDHKLIVHESQGQNMFGIYTNYSTVSDRYPLGTSLDYSIEAPSIDMTEQVWEITYVTTSDYITGGAENGDCALKTFVVTVYKAPTGWKYKSNQRDRNNKQQLIKCTEG